MTQGHRTTIIVAALIGMGCSFLPWITVGDVWSIRAVPLNIQSVATLSMLAVPLVVASMTSDGSHLDAVDGFSIFAPTVIVAGIAAMNGLAIVAARAQDDAIAPRAGVGLIVLAGSCLAILGAWSKVK